MKTTIIINKVGEHLYLAQTEEGNVCQRNRKLLKATTETGEEPDNSNILGEVKPSHSNLAADAESPSPSTGINNSQQNLLLDDYRTIHPTLTDTVMNPSSNNDQDKASNVQIDQEPEVTKATHSGRHVKPPSRFCDL